jgi:hypothetical protein
MSVQLGDHDTTTSDAVRLALRLMHEAQGLKLEAARVHRDTCRNSGRLRAHVVISASLSSCCR